MKKINLLYWIFTGLFAALMLVATVPDIMVIPDAVKFMAILGYPVYLIRFLGIAKLLGIIAVLVPGFPRIKEWAYAGLCFDLVGAWYSQIATLKPDSGNGWMLMSIWLILLFVSYIFYHKRLKAQQGNIS